MTKVIMSYIVFMKDHPDYLAMGKYVFFTKIGQKNPLRNIGFASVDKSLLLKAKGQLNKIPRPKLILFVVCQCKALFTCNGI